LPPRRQRPARLRSRSPWRPGSRGRRRSSPHRYLMPLAGGWLGKSLHLLQLLQRTVIRR
jgi:hypothetical protein